MKKWECIQVNHHRNVGETIEEWEKNGWSLHTYACSQLRGSEINHYLLFEREEKLPPSVAAAAAAAAATAAVA